MQHNLSIVNRKLYAAKAHDEGRGNLQRNIIERREGYLDDARSTVWHEASKFSYQTINDYVALLVQLGFILFFAAVFPLAPLIALVNNLIMLRLRAYRLCYVVQRPLSQKCSGMGVWENILQVMGVIGVLTTLALFGLTSKVLHNHIGPFIGSIGIAILLFVFEHLILFFKYWLFISVPRIPARILRLQGRDHVSVMRKKEAKRQSAIGKKPQDKDREGSPELVAPLLSPSLEPRNKRVSFAPQPGASSASESAPASPTAAVVFGQSKRRSQLPPFHADSASDLSSDGDSDAEENHIPSTVKVSLDSVAFNSPEKSVRDRESICSRMREFQSRRTEQKTLSPPVSPLRQSLPPIKAPRRSSVRVEALQTERDATEVSTDAKSEDVPVVHTIHPEHEVVVPLQTKRQSPVTDSRQQALETTPIPLADHEDSGRTHYPASARLPDRHLSQRPLKLRISSLASKSYLSRDEVKRLIEEATKDKFHLVLATEEQDKVKENNTPNPFSFASSHANNKVPPPG